MQKDGSVRRQIFSRDLEARCLSGRRESPLTRRWHRDWAELRLVLASCGGEAVRSPTLIPCGRQLPVEGGRPWGTPFEMAAKGEDGCRLVADPARHEKLREAMIAHLDRKSPGSKDLDVVDPGQSFRLRLI